MVFSGRDGVVCECQVRSVGNNHPVRQEGVVGTSSEWVQLLPTVFGDISVGVFGGLDLLCHNYLLYMEAYNQMQSLEWLVEAVSAPKDDIA